MAAAMGVLASVAVLIGAPTVGIVIVAAVDARRQRRQELCACMHTRAAHEHYQLTDECGHCMCPGFVSAVQLARSRAFTPVGSRRLRGVA